MNIGCIHPNKSVKSILPIILYSLLLVRFILDFIYLCYTDLLSYVGRLTHAQFSRSQGQT